MDSNQTVDQTEFRKLFKLRYKLNRNLELPIVDMLTITVQDT